MPITPTIVARIAAMSLSSNAFWSPTNATVELTASLMSSFHEKAMTKANAAASAMPI